MWLHKYEFDPQLVNAIVTVRITSPFQWLPIETKKAHNDTAFNAKFRRLADQSLFTCEIICGRNNHPNS